MNKTIFEEIYDEEERQNSKWGIQTHPLNSYHFYPDWDMLRLSEHYEIPTISRAQQINDTLDGSGQITWASILQEEVSEAILSRDPKLMRTELIQVAALCVQMIKQIDKDPKNPEYLNDYDAPNETVFKTYTFGELVELGIQSGANLVNGMPWSFTIPVVGDRVTHETDTCYLITKKDDHVSWKMTPSDVLTLFWDGSIKIEKQ